MRYLVWLFRAFIFFTLFAFALNNLQVTTVRWFFGFESNVPMVFVVLVAFAGGCAVGVLAMVPAWWHHRRVARSQLAPAGPAPAPARPSTAAPSDFAPEHPPREGL